MTAAEVIIDGRRLTAEQSLLLRATVQSMLRMLDAEHWIPSSITFTSLREINRMLCGELSPPNEGE